MTQIKILPNNLINQIAAGEVVERPASVIKELVENSIDAGATIINVEVKDAGKTLIKVTDNGCGMTKDDLMMAIQRHATSKISSEADLWNIKTMGFRGEALPSISSVSQLTIRSCLLNSISGTEIVCDGGEIVRTTETAMNKGTQIIVSDLFFNTPARQKFLRKETTELTHITHLINTLALANPEIAFKFTHNGHIIFDLPRATDLIARVADIFGRVTSNAMIPVYFSGNGFEITGFVGKPVIARSSSQHQYFFINKRFIQNALLANTVKEAFHSLLMEDKKPVFVINIKIDPAMVDVNVHPRKMEVRFSDQQMIIRMLYNAVKAALDRNSLIPLGMTEAGRYMSDNRPKITPAYSPEKPQENTVQDALNFSKLLFANRENQTLNKALKGDNLDQNFDMKTVFQVANSYIVAQGENGILLIDQHAAHERVRYEELMNQMEKEEKLIQPLLMGIQIDFTHDEIEILKEEKETFVALGFDVEHFGGKTYMINAVPAFLSKENIEEVLKGVIDDILNVKTPTKFQGKTEAMIHYMACRSAIKFGQKLSMEEMQGLIEKMEQLKRPYTCPHGRPTMISLNLDELAKMFGRK